ncbi:MAG: hypothetical protein LCH37_13050 [Bacteroidetes bacterium]|nr:hypothetical protein [Bacteroidota bacterium]
MKNETNEVEVAVGNVKHLVNDAIRPKALSGLIRKGIKNLSMYAIKDAQENREQGLDEVVYWLDELAESIYPLVDDPEVFDLHKD